MLSRRTIAGDSDGVKDIARKVGENGAGDCEGADCVAAYDRRR